MRCAPVRRRKRRLRKSGSKLLLLKTPAKSCNQRSRKSRQRRSLHAENLPLMRLISRSHSRGDKSRWIQIPTKFLSVVSLKSSRALTVGNRRPTRIAEDGFSDQHL